MLKRKVAFLCHSLEKDLNTVCIKDTCVMRAALSFDHIHRINLNMRPGKKEIKLVWSTQVMNFRIKD